MVKIRWSASIVSAFRRVRRSTSTDAFQTCDAGRAGGIYHRRRATPELTIGPAEADQAGARLGQSGVVIEALADRLADGF